MPTSRKRTGRTGGGIVTQKAVELYLEGLAISQRKNYERHQASRKLADELRADVCLPCLLDSEPCFLIAVAPEREPEYRETWRALKDALEAAIDA